MVGRQSYKNFQILLIDFLHSNALSAPLTIPQITNHPAVWKTDPRKDWKTQQVKYVLREYNSRIPKIARQYCFDSDIHPDRLAEHIMNYVVTAEHEDKIRKQQRRAKLAEPSSRGLNTAGAAAGNFFPQPAIKQQPLPPFETLNSSYLGISSKFNPSFGSSSGSDPYQYPYSGAESRESIPNPNSQLNQYPGARHHANSNLGSITQPHQPSMFLSSSSYPEYATYQYPPASPSLANFDFTLPPLPDGLELPASYYERKDAVPAKTATPVSTPPQQDGTPTLKTIKETILTHAPVAQAEQLKTSQTEVKSKRESMNDKSKVSVEEPKTKNTLKGLGLTWAQTNESGSVVEHQYKGREM